MYLHFTLQTFYFTFKHFINSLVLRTSGTALHRGKDFAVSPPISLSGLPSPLLRNDCFKKLSTKQFFIFNIHCVAKNRLVNTHSVKVGRDRGAFAPRRLCSHLYAIVLARRALPPTVSRSSVPRRFPDVMSRSPSERRSRYPLPQLAPRLGVRTFLSDCNVGATIQRTNIL